MHKNWLSRRQGFLYVWKKCGLEAESTESSLHCLPQPGGKPAGAATPGEH